ncbi:MAG: 3-deoxy-D-manno-octulosonic acid transferase [Pyrinomonadaceae bacterium]|nr:3-deoxy-D-manno-octulosonic acid transferase [Pyrinomonadaceae bacterium]
MYLVYSSLLTLGFLVLLPRFLLDALRHGKYVAGFRERLGALSKIASGGRPVVWIHCVSVGESQAARPLVHGIQQRFPNHVLVISTTTLTGQTLARELFKAEAAKVFYFPFDWRWTVRRALKAINPSAVLIIETELWPGFLYECNRQQIPVALVNGRISHQSFRRYKWVSGFVSRVLESVSVGIMQTEADAERIRNLGLRPDKVFISGNLKFDAGSMPTSNSSADELQERFNITSEAPLVLAASTHAPEERVVLAAFQDLRNGSSQTIRLLLAPRHPERFAEVASLLNGSGLTWTRRSNASSSIDRTCDAILLDTIGELPTLYSLAAVVFVGGSIANHGGHNILEPAAVGAAIITGAHTHNFEDIVSFFSENQAIIQLPVMSDGQADSALADVLKELLADIPRRRELGQRAKHLVEQNQGATQRTLDLLDSLLVSDRQQPSTASSAGA